MNWIIVDILRIEDGMLVELFNIPELKSLTVKLGGIAYCTRLFLQIEDVGHVINVDTC